MGKMIELKLPKFLLAEEPTKEYVGVEWIYSPQYLSLIMIVISLILIFNQTTTE